MAGWRYRSAVGEQARNHCSSMTYTTTRHCVLSNQGCRHPLSNVNRNSATRISTSSQSRRASPGVMVKISKVSSLSHSSFFGFWGRFPSWDKSPAEVFFSALSETSHRPMCRHAGGWDHRLACFECVDSKKDHWRCDAKVSSCAAASGIRTRFLRLRVCGSRSSAAGQSSLAGWVEKSVSARLRQQAFSKLSQVGYITAAHLQLTTPRYP